MLGGFFVFGESLQKEKKLIRNPGIEEMGIPT
jgi:hypothetical protein